MKDKKCKTKECKNLINNGMSKSGLCNRCSAKKWKGEHKEEMATYRKEHWKKFPEKHERAKKMQNDWWKKFSRENPEYISEIHSKIYDEKKEYYKDYSKKYYEENKEKRLEQTRINQNRRYREDEGFRIRKRLGGSLGMVIRVYIKTGKIRNPLKKYGIDWVGIIKQLSPIPKDRHKYHVDHIIPLFKFDLTDIEQIQIAFAPENHRWLLIKDNLGRDRKGV